MTESPVLPDDPVGAPSDDRRRRRVDAGDPAIAVHDGDALGRRLDDVLDVGLLHEELGREDSSSSAMALKPCASCPNSSLRIVADARPGVAFCQRLHASRQARKAGAETAAAAGPGEAAAISMAAAAQRPTSQSMSLVRCSAATQQRIVFQQHGADDRILGMFDRNGQYVIAFCGPSLKLARNAILQSLADFVAGVVIERLAGLVFFVGGMRPAASCCGRRPGNPVRTMVLQLQEFAQRRGPLEQRRWPSDDLKTIVSANSRATLVASVNASDLVAAICVKIATPPTSPIKAAALVMLRMIWLLMRTSWPRRERRHL